MKKILLLFITFFMFSAMVYAETVVFNTKTYKYHKPGCQWANRCTVNCIKIEKKDAIKRGGVPCKVCGG